MAAPILLGQSDFVTLRRSGACFVDKSILVRTVLDAPAQVQLYTRPRRFGKTLGLSMLRAFFESDGHNADLFADLAIARDEAAWALQGRYPVIWLSFKDIKHSEWAEARRALVSTIASEVRRHTEALDRGAVQADLRAALRDVAREAGEPTLALRLLTEALHAAYGAPVLVLIDEYDAPLLTAWRFDAGNYLDQATAWVGALLSATLKDNPHLFRGVLTGVLRVGKESLFSGLNNVVAYGVAHALATEPFGFNSQEVEHLLADYGRVDSAEPVQRWYDGYRFGAHRVYNPWSVLHFLADAPESCLPYWVNTSDNALVHHLLLHTAEASEDLEAVLRGVPVRRCLDDAVNLRGLHADALWTLLLHTGYLTTSELRFEAGEPVANLVLPNEEVALVWRKTFRDWLVGSGGRIQPLQSAILSGDAERVEALLTRLLLRHVSSHDLGSTQIEAFYHAFVLGLLVTLEPTHSVRSNREYGVGRADLCLTPKVAGLPGVVVEFKAARDGDLVSTAVKALEQIRTKAYATELHEAGVQPVFAYGIAMAGKQVAVKVERLTSGRR